MKALHVVFWIEMSEAAIFYRAEMSAVAIMIQCLYLGEPLSQVLNAKELIPDGILKEVLSTFNGYYGYIENHCDWDYI